MGFGIFLDDVTADMTERLSTSPMEVMNRPFLGYMFFLFSEVDRGVWSWFREHAPSLDSLTGEDIAFGVFSRRYSVVLDTRGYDGVAENEGVNRASTRLGEFSALDHKSRWDVARLVKSGKFGWVQSGDEIIGVNEGMHAMARSLKLTSKMPCILVMDGLPDPGGGTVIPMSEASLGGLYSRILRAVGHLQEHPRYDWYREKVKQLEVQSRDVRRLERTRIQPSALRDSDWYLRTLGRIGALLHSCHLKKLTEKLKALDREYPDLGFGRILEQIDAGDAIRRERTLYQLRRYEEFDWPLDPEESERLEHVRATYFAAILPRAVGSTSRFESVFDLKAATAELAADNDSWTSRALEMLPGVVEWERAEMGRLRDLSTRLSAAEFQMLETAREILQDTSRPSFSCLLVDTASPARPASLDRATLHSVLMALQRRELWQLAAPAGPDPADRPTAFASYASEDRERVVERVLGMKAWEPPRLDVFLDFHTMRAGERWRERLAAEISARERFLLFWSRAARASSHVRSEWELALELGGLDSITPVPLELPHVAPPPAQLEELHFADALLYNLRFAR